MATTVKKIQTITVSLEAKPGSLAKVYGALKESGLNIIASWAYEMGPGQAQGVFYPTDFGKTLSLFSKLGLNPTQGSACHVEGDDQIGAYAEILRKAAQAGVNLHATDAFGIGGKFAAVLFADEKDVPALCKALGC